MVQLQKYCSSCHYYQIFPTYRILITVITEIVKGDKKSSTPNNTNFYV